MRNESNGCPDYGSLQKDEASVYRAYLRVKAGLGREPKPREIRRAEPGLKRLGESLVTLRACGLIPGGDEPEPGDEPCELSREDIRLRTEAVRAAKIRKMISGGTTGLTKDELCEALKHLDAR